MILFLLKKNFFDGWENIINLIFPNLICDIFVLAIYFGYRFFRFPFSILSLVIIFLGISLLVVASGAFGKNALSIAGFETAHLSTYFKNLWSAFKDYFKFGMIVALIVLSAVTGIPFYIGINGFVGFMLAAILFLFILTLVLGLQWFIPLKEILKLNFKKTFKKCFVILFDNFAFSIFMFCYVWWPYIICFLVLNLKSALQGNPGILGICVALGFLLPGWSGIVLSYVNALRLRLYKYDWLDQHADLKNAKERKNIPWEALLREDSMALGKKSLRSIIAPWKSRED